ncbi:cytochrome P450 [Stereum hirsutum FP-91666 SS1]|uniref:cytochrome P450 n=1 Tax=Stereum hirsutum (strain FP-91666) TaxID=721885 RepID=UPI0004449BAF|nr:cytochrome P450 [Stereum hirsutum FP-91666 SS1]EIM84242.1 cytochrome P450 [Stereum hirsutum FP-91666 SS1]
MAKYTTPSLIYQGGGDFIDHLSSYVIGKNIVENAYGIKIDSPRHKYVKLSKETHEFIQHAVIPGSFLVDFIPLLRYVPAWVPGAGFKRLARLAKSKGQEMVDGAFSEVKAALSQGQENYSLARTLLEDESQRQQSVSDYEYTVKWAVGSLYGAGTESYKAQKELDELLKQKRLPVFSDRPQLPFINAIVQETLRYHPPTPMGYYLPKGCIVLPNIWGMSRDRRVYGDDASDFHPERFMAIDRPQAVEPGAHAFGLGRRACPGYHYAMGTLFISIASILAVFDIKQGDDPHKEVLTKPQFTGGFVSHPKSFPCKITPRSSSAIDLILTDIWSGTDDY